MTNPLVYQCAILSRAFCVAERIDSSASVNTIKGIGSNRAGSIGIELEGSIGGMVARGGTRDAALPEPLDSKFCFSRHWSHIAELIKRPSQRERMFSLEVLMN